MSYVIGIDLGGSSVKALALTREGQVLARYHASFDPDRPRHFASTLRDLERRIQQERGGAPEHLGLSAPGLAAKDGRSIAFMPGRLEGLEGLVWGDYLGASQSVPVLNDAHAALMGEVWQGAARGETDVILLTLGTGVGGAALIDGHLLKGAIGRAGHLGHICLDPTAPRDICNTPGSLEFFLGNYRILERTHGRYASTHDLIRAYEAGDPAAAEPWLASVSALAAAIASFVNILDPAVVILGGGIAKAGPALFEPLREKLAPIEWRPGGHQVRVVAAQLGEYAGAYGAAYNALTPLPPPAPARSLAQDGPGSPRNAA